MFSLRSVLYLGLATACVSSVAAAALVNSASRSAGYKKIEYPKCYGISDSCKYYDDKKDIGCCTKGASCVYYKEKGEGRYCFKYNDYYYYDYARKESYGYAKDGTKVVKGKKDGKDEYYTWKDDYKVKLIYPKSYYEKISKYYDDDKGKYWYAEKGEKKYVKEYYEEEDGKSCFYDEYGTKVYNYFYYGYDGSTYCYGKEGKKYYVYGDEAWYYKDEKKKDVKVYVKIDDIKDYYEESDGVYKYDHEGKKYYVIVYKKEYVKKYTYYSKKKSTYYKPKVVKKDDYEYTKTYDPKKYETTYDYNSYYYGKKTKPGKVIPRPVASPEVAMGGGMRGGRRGGNGGSGSLGSGGGLGSSPPIGNSLGGL